MKFRFAFLAMTLGVVLTAGEEGRKAAAKSTPPAPAGIPAAAVLVAPYTYRHVDAQGKTWLYRKSPFGWMKVEEKTAPQPSASQAPVADSVIEEGDSLRFEKKTPFGTQRWSRKKSELSEAEKLAWERATQARAAAKNASQE